MNLDYEYYKTTRSLCPGCKKILPAKIVFYNDSVYMLKNCKEHGEFFTLIYGDRRKYIEALKISKPALYPLEFFSENFNGCGASCGLCPEHQQHTCLPIIEITDHCNMSCPICLAGNHNGWHMPVEKFKKIVDNLIKAEGSLDMINISGGEPTLHPELLEIVEAANRPEILTVSISTNGKEFLRDKNLLTKLIDRNVFISLQFDGFDDDSNIKLRGEGVLEEKLGILELLEKFSARTSLVMTVMRGVNHKEIGKVVQYFLKKDFIRSLMFQPIVFANPGLEYDVEKVITIPGIAAEIAAGSGGIIRESDIINLPCSHPTCFALTYLLKLDNSTGGEGEYIPIPRLVEVEQYLDTIKNRTAPGLESESYEKIKNNIYSLWSSSGIQPQSGKILHSLKNIMCEIGQCGKDMTPQKLFNVMEKNIKSLFIHHFMDAYNFDFSRVMKCCNQYPLDENRLIPCCIYNNMERKR
ncbi:MAG: radical SAM protein [Candidatus Aminicenantes bacterium]|nr:radical SAM protein [Candidatus Aminicenantes bacterium]